MRTAFLRFVEIGARPCMLLIAAALAAEGCSAPTPAIDTREDAVAATTLPGVPLYRGKLDGADAGVILDTGAALSVIDAQLARRLGLTPRSRWFPRRYAFAGGTQVTRSYVTADRIEVAGLAVGPLELPVVDLEAGGGIADVLLLGMDVLRECRVLFDAGAREVRFLNASSRDEVATALRALHPGRAFVPLELSWKSAGPHVAVAHGADAASEFLVDTGAFQSGISEETMRAWDRDGARSEHSQSKLELIENLAVGPWRVWLVAKVEAGQSDRLGFDLWKHLTFLWDGPEERLWIAAPRPGERNTLAAGSSVHDVLREHGLDPEDFAPRER